MTTTLALCLADMRAKAHTLGMHVHPDSNDDAYDFAVRYAAWVDGQQGISSDDARTACTLGWML